MKIAIDIDEVIVEFVERYLEFVAKKGLKKIRYEDVFSLNLWEVLEIKKELFIELLDKCDSIGYFDNVKFIKGAKESVNFLNENHDIIFITSRSKKRIKKTREFIFEEFSILGNKVFFSGDVVGKGKNKDEICRDLGIKIIIEDSEEESLGYAKNGLRVLLLDKPWNQSVGHENVCRCGDWGEILERVEDLRNEER